MSADRSANAPYDWEHYADDWRSSPAYEAQEAVIESFLDGLPKDSIRGILEVGPGFGRITELLVKHFLPQGRFYSFMDVAQAPLDAAAAVIAPIEPFDSILASVADYDWTIGYPPAPDSGPDYEPGFDLVVAVEVLMHIPPTQVTEAIRRLRGHTKQSGYLLTCDWTQALDPRVTVRTQNYRHNYPELYLAAEGHWNLTTQVTGLQTVCLVSRAKGHHGTDND